MDRACIGNKCANPCPGTCGLNAECIVSNHAPSCFCIEGYTGNPAVACHVPPPRMYLSVYLFVVVHVHVTCNKRVWVALSHEYNLLVQNKFRVIADEIIRIKFL